MCGICFSSNIIMLVSLITSNQKRHNHTYIHGTCVSKVQGIIIGYISFKSLMDEVCATQACCSNQDQACICTVILNSKFMTFTCHEFHVESVFHGQFIHLEISYHKHMLATLFLSWQLHSNFIYHGTSWDFHSIMKKP